MPCSQVIQFRFQRSSQRTNGELLHLLIDLLLQSDQIVLGMCSRQQTNGACQTLAGSRADDELQTERFGRAVRDGTFFFSL